MILRAVLHAKERWGTTLVISSHDREWLERISDRTVTVFNGRLFKEDRINILTGPFEKRGDYWYKEGAPLGDYDIPVPMSPECNSSAIIPASALNLAHDSSRIPDNAISFKSRITGVALSRSKEHLYVSLFSSDCCLISTIDSSEAGIFTPGQIVCVYYDPANLTLR
jgi:tungstate transport system ATP-binding protein